MMNGLREETERTSRELLSYISKAVSPYHAVEEGCRMLREAGFQELDMREAWTLERNGAYFVRPYGTSLFSFRTGENFSDGMNFHIAAAHTDHPCLHIKPAAEIPGKEYAKVNVEVYGGPVLNTWLDRPLSVAGRVALRSSSVFAPRMILIDFARPLMTIPNLAIHMNREVNKGVELKKQTDLLPLFGKITEGDSEGHYFRDFLGKEIRVASQEILDFDLYVYNAEQGCTLGRQEEFLSSPRLDNLTSCFALLKGVIAGKRQNGVNLIALYDNEEIGSKTKQGADSALLTMLLEKMADAFEMSRSVFHESILRSFLLSVDVAHALHPNHAEKYDPVNYGCMNSGVMLKISSNQRYIFDTEAVAAVCQLCDKAGVEYKKYVNHSDLAGGGTLGPIISSWLPMKTVDLGIPILAMHSARELMGTEDQVGLNRLMTAFFDEE